MSNRFYDSLFAFLFIFILAACSANVPSGDGKSTSGGSASGGNTSDADTGTYSPTTVYVTATAPSGVSIFTHKRGASWTTPCEINIDATAVADRDIECVTEVEELDTWAQNLTLAYNIPDNVKCSYLAFKPYFFIAYEIGRGPTLVNKQIAANGVVTVTSSSGGDAGITLSVVNGAVTCSLNHGAVNDNEDPNCCLGEYQLITTDKTTVPDTITTTTEDWGGTAAACLGGTGRDHFPNPKTGWPRASLERLSVGGSALLTSSTGLQMGRKPVKSQDPWFSALQTTFASYLNFGTELFDEHAYQTVTKLKNDFSSSAINYSRSYGVKAAEDEERGSNLMSANYVAVAATRPAAFDTPTSYPSFVTNPWYLWECYDAARETYGRVKLEIREWNTEDEFNLKDLGDPDETGAETDFPGRPLNDVWDWDDFITAVTDFPESSW